MAAMNCNNTVRNALDDAGGKSDKAWNCLQSHMTASKLKAVITYIVWLIQSSQISDTLLLVLASPKSVWKWCQRKSGVKFAGDVVIVKSGDHEKNSQHFCSVVTMMTTSRLTPIELLTVIDVGPHSFRWYHDSRETAACRQVPVL